MAKPTFNGQISLGNIMQLVVLLVALGGAWYSLQLTSAMSAKDVGANTVTIRALEGRVRVLETSSARDSAQLGALQRDIGEIKNGQTEMRSLLRQILQTNSNR